MGILASVIYAMQRGKGARSMTPADFMPDFEQSRRQQSQEEIQQRLAAWADAQDAKTRKR